MLGSLYDISTRIASGLMGGAPGETVSPGSIAGTSVMLPVTSLFEAGRAAGIPPEWLIPAP